MMWLLTAAALAGGPLVSAPGTSTATATTVTSDTLTNCEALSPVSGDWCHPSDSPLRLQYNGSAWLSFWGGHLVTPPVHADWSDLNLQGSSTRTDTGGIQLLTLDDTGDTLNKQGGTQTVTTGNTWTFGFIHEDLSGDGNDLDFTGAGFYEAGTGKIIFIAWLSGASAAAYRVYRAATLDGAAASTPYSASAARYEGPVHWVQLEWSAATITIRKGPSPVGPWRTVHSEGEGDYFTVDPDSVFWFGSNRSNLDGLTYQLMHFLEE